MASLKQRIPNLLTFARVLAVPICLALMLVEIDTTQRYQLLAIIFVAACLTDFLDGYLARKWNAVTPLGTMLDQISDKLIIALMLVYLIVVMGPSLLLPVMVMLLRELYISGLREFLALRSIPLPVSKLGKWKTMTQMVAISCLLGRLAINPPHELKFSCRIIKDVATNTLKSSCADQPIWLRAIQEGGIPLLYIAAILAFISAVTYTAAARKSFR